MKRLKTRRSTLSRAASRLGRLLGEGRCVVIGGLAVIAHGHVRATDDVDVMVRLPLKEAQRLLSSHGIAATLVHGDRLEGDVPCLHGRMGEVDFDVLPEHVPIAWDRTVVIEAGGSRLRIVDLDDLLKLKLRARGHRDLWDVAMLVHLHPSHEARARELAAAYGVRDRLEIWLDDPRTRASVRSASRRSRGRKR